MTQELRQEAVWGRGKGEGGGGQKIRNNEKPKDEPSKISTRSASTCRKLNRDDPRSGDTQGNTLGNTKCIKSTGGDNYFIDVMIALLF